MLWKTFGQLCKRTGLGDEPRRLFAEISQNKLVDVGMQTNDGLQILRTCIAEPEKHQKVLLDMLQHDLVRASADDPEVFRGIAGS